MSCFHGMCLCSLRCFQPDAKLLAGPFFTSVPATRVGGGKHSFASNEVAIFE
jgi:hypothetical protein